MPLMTFDEALARGRENEQPSILLGNGFSRAWQNEIFNYANLLERADFGENDAAIRRLFEQLDTYDFEAVMRTMQSALLVLQTYASEPELQVRLVRDQQLLKDALITAISNTHPDLPNEVTDEQYTAVRKCLAKFAQIYTVNYDLLFYWARNMGALPPEHYHTDDGFRGGPKWQDHGTDQNVYFLHGALHIYESGAGIMKHSFAARGVRIIDQVRRNLNLGKFPLFVAEPSAPKKLQRIEHNPYLSYCFRSLASLEGTFFILGHSMDENDKHVFDKVRDSRVNKVFVSVYGDEHSEENMRSKANAIAFLGSAQRSVEFFDAVSVPLWGAAEQA